MGATNTHTHLNGDTAVEDDYEGDPPAANHGDPEARPDADVHCPVEAEEVGMVQVDHVFLQDTTVLWSTRTGEGKD